MQDIINKRSELINYLKKGEKDYVEKIYTKEEVLNKEFSAISFSIRDEYIDNMVTPYDSLLTDLEFATEEANEEMYVKGIIVDVDNQQGYSILHLQNKDVNKSVSCSEEVVVKYGAYFETGHVVVVKCHCYNNKLYMHFLIDYSTTDSFMAEENYINGVSYNLIKNAIVSVTDNPKALVKQATYFISTKGTKCLRLTLLTPHGQESYITCKNSFNVLPKGIVAGMFVEYQLSNNEAFINNVKQIYI